ncbi:MAG: metallophosphoesterase, partial [Anaerovoracaceae bacterium]
MKIFAIADLHLSFDPRVEKPMDDFGGEWINYTERIKKDWEEKVSSEDIVVISGDISWALKLDEAIADLDW